MQLARYLALTAGACVAKRRGFLRHWRRAGAFVTPVISSGPRDSDADEQRESGHLFSVTLLAVRRLLMSVPLSLPLRTASIGRRELV